MELVNGKEFWEHGAPDKNFIILGFIEQTSSIHPILISSHNRNEIIKYITESGGDGAILISRDQLIAGYQSTPNYGTGTYDLKPKVTTKKVLAVFKYQ